MKAAVLEGQKQITCREVEVPVPGANEVLLRVRAASICGSDVHRYLNGHRMYPLIPGHEAAGFVVAVGPGGDPLLVGQRAAVIPLIPCMECAYCQQGLYSACTQYSFIGSRRPGSFAEYVTLPVGNLFLLPEGVDFAAGALVEPASVALHLLEMGRFAPGQCVAVLGAGSVGLLTIQWLRKLGAGRILVSDLAEENLAYARTLGADATFNPRDGEVVTRMRTESGGGVDLALELAGAPQTLVQAIQLARPRGSVVLGGYQPKEAQFSAEVVDTVTRKELGVFGTMMSYSAPFPGHEWQMAAEALQSGDLNSVAMISHRFPLAEVEAVFRAIAGREFAYRKILLIP